ncbi:MAG: rhomboid family intramembrane serine protease, partial [Bacilli bacterium]|nr:rhomboid family intramembrane serine protease [Bacilli bacterium]
DLEDNINVDVPKNIEFVNIKNEKELKNNSILEMVFPDMKEKLKYTEEGMQLFLKITTDINEHNIKDNEKVEKVFKPKYPIITYILILLNVFMYIIPILCNKEQTILEQFCIFGDYVRSGEYYRLLTGTFLHANIIHLFCNMYALYILGTQLESFVGKIKFLIIYIFSALTGSLLSLIFLNNGISIGASGAIFGLTGALIYFGLHYRVYLGSVVKTNLIPIIVLNLLLGFMMKGIDNWAHIGGLIGGILCNMALGVKYKSKTHERINGIIISIIYVAFLIYMGFIYSK